ncbi:MAG: hypothetical protein QOF88_1897 [Mycobacterium sp.]|jgi:hypothetical protein|nr:hypothetical protein [Mycobacterium sp.]MDT5287008.1 hypothetical protein [Mycobacterium sp.]
MTTSFASVASLRGRTRLLIGASLAPAANAQYDADFYDWCMNNLDEGSDYCCEHSGGVVRSGACIDPDDLLATVDVGPSRPVHPIRPGVVAPATRNTWNVVG